MSYILTLKKQNSRPRSESKVLVNTAPTLLRLLSDGQYHSAEALQHTLNCTADALYDSLHELNTASIAIEYVSNLGYRLQQPFEPIDPVILYTQLSDLSVPYVLDIRDSCTSTNTELLHIAREQFKRQFQYTPYVLTCEQQQTGRGRLGRSWISSIGHSLTFSLLWPWSHGQNKLSGLALAIGISIIETLRTFGVCTLKLKWPNDLVVSDSHTDAKLGGILIEVQGDIRNHCAVVIGVGLNVYANTSDHVDRAIAYINQQTEHPISRTQLLSQLTINITKTLQQFEQTGFSAFQSRWNQYAAWLNQPVIAHLPDGQTIEGICQGIDTDGALRITYDGKEKRLIAGDVSLKRKP